MTSNREQRLHELFSAAGDLPQEQWSEFLAARTADDPTLAAEVMEMLQMPSDGGALLARAHAAVGQVLGDVIEDATPKQIGPYRIERVLGSGGMGTVYLARQEEPVQREVALKVIKLGMDSAAVLARFQQERQALALMQHNGIARVLDCGATGRGQPYFVMEYVRGVPLTKFCDRERLTIEQRLHLMQQVCAAILHAHDKGVVHRDLKPANVLAVRDGDDIQCKVIDFGLAKALGQKLVAASLFTEAGQLIGTPGYMSPEQADQAHAVVDERTDVYSLGVILYELLTGQLPFNEVDLQRAGVRELSRLIGEVEPPRPSSRIGEHVKTAARAAAARGTSTAVLRRMLRSDLDGVVLKAMEKDRCRRYASVAALAEDLQRFLDHKPVTAIQPSLLQSFAKLVRRQRGRLLAGGIAILAACTGAVLTAVYWSQPPATNPTAAPVADSTGKTDGAMPAPEKVEPVAQKAQFPPVAIDGGDWRLVGDDLMQTEVERSGKRRIEMVSNGQGIGPGNLLLFGSPEWSDYDLSVEAFVFSQNGTHAFKVCYHAASIDTYCMLAVGNYYNKACDVAWVHGGKWSRDDANYKAGGIDLRGWHEVRIGVRGTHARCYLDKKFLFDAHDERFRSGRIGFETWDSVVRFRNLKVMTPDGKPLMVGFNDLELPVDGDTDKQRRH